MNTFLEDNLSTTINEWLGYHQAYLHHRYYKGLVMMKNPFDLIIYEEIIYDIKPTIIIEIGGAGGGSTLWLRDHARMLGTCSKIITVDTNPETAKNINTVGDKNLIEITGDCNDLKTINRVKQYISNADIVMIIEDSAHYYEHTINVLNNYKNIVTIGSYFIIEDGICDVLNFGPVPGPMRAVEKWIISNPNYQIDRSKERYIMTYNPKGYLKRMY